MRMGVPSKSAFRGCLLGQCLGDALGYPVEGHDEYECSHFIFDIASQWFKGTAPSPYQWSGQYTDDSQLARELLSSLVENGGFDGSDYAGRIADIFRSNKIVGKGIASDQAARNLNRGTHWQESGVPAPSAGNGTAMRAAPIGLFYFDNIDKLIETAHWQGYITHQDPRCSAGSIAIAGAVTLSLRKELDDTSAFIETIAEWMRNHDSGFADIFLHLKQWISLKPSEAVGPISIAGKPNGYIEEWPGISPFVVCSVLWSVYSFLRYRDSFWDAIATSISVGGDVDTTGAMTGAISGAWLGEEALPRPLLKMLNDHGKWRHSDLTALADRCCEIKCGV